MAKTQEDAVGLYSKQLDVKKKELELGELTSEQDDNTTESEVYDLAGEILNRDTKPVTGLLKVRSNIPGTEAIYTKRLTKQLRDKLSVDARSAMTGSGAISDFEAQMLADSVTALDTNLSDDDFKRELMKIRSVFEGKQSPGLETGAIDDVGRNLEKPAFNIYGEIAKDGDLSYNEQTGSYYTYGDTDTDEPSTFKTTENDGVIENGFIRFLANSEFLPIAGAVVGGISGAGAGSILTGAAGAVAGKSMQQGLRELYDPERQTASQMATAVIIEGTTDALLGGALFGVMKGAKVGVKFVLGASGEGVEAGVKKTTRNLVAKGLNVKPSVEQAKYARTFKGADLVDDIMEKFGIPKSGKALQEGAQAGRKEAGEKLQGLFAGKVAKTADVIDELNIVKKKGLYESFSETGEKLLTPKPGRNAAVNTIDEYISLIKAEGDTIPLSKLNVIKTDLQKSFTKSLETSSLSKELVQDASTGMRKYIEKFHKEIAGTNKEKQMMYMAEQLGERLDQKKAAAFFKISDVALGAANPALLVGKKSIDLFVGAFTEPLVQAKILNTALKTAVASGNKVAVRNMLLFMNKLGISWTAAVGASAVTTKVQPPPTPGLDLEQPGMNLETTEEVQPGFMYR